MAEKELLPVAPLGAVVLLSVATLLLAAIATWHGWHWAEARRDVPGFEAAAPCPSDVDAETAGCMPESPGTLIADGPVRFRSGRRSLVVSHLKGTRRLEVEPGDTPLPHDGPVTLRFFGNRCTAIRLNGKWLPTDQDPRLQAAEELYDIVIFGMMTAGAAVFTRLAVRSRR